MSRSAAPSSRFKEPVIAAVSLAGSAIFLDSLRYKFTDHPKTQVIFGRFDDWAAGFGADGLFAHHGLFSQHVIGSAELVAAGLLLLGLVPALRVLSGVGAALAFAVMAGAVSFHLFTLPGIDPNHDGGGLFAAAVAWLIGSAVLVLLRRNELQALVTGILRLRPSAPAPLR